MGDNAFMRMAAELEVSDLRRRVQTLSKALEPFANIALEQDGNKRAEDMISCPDLSITPADIRRARKAMGW